jgi:hypothetical protein
MPEGREFRNGVAVAAVIEALCAAARLITSLLLLVLLMGPSQAFAHDIAASDRAAVQAIAEPAPFVFLYLGAKHMVTGLDHVLFLTGVVFFLFRVRDVVLYVSMFTIGHSVTLLSGVLLNTGANPYMVDAIIGLSVAYKGFENVGGFRRLGLATDTRLAVLVFGLFHGLGLATKVTELALSDNGMLANLVSFNLGVEVGQVLVLGVVVAILNLWRATRFFASSAFYANLALMIAGFTLVGYHLGGYFSS